MKDNVSARKYKIIEKGKEVKTLTVKKKSSPRVEPSKKCRATAAKRKENLNRTEKKKAERIGKKKNRKKKEKSEGIEPVAASCCSATVFGATNRLRYVGKL